MPNLVCSLVICTHHRFDLLNSALAELAKQNTLPQMFEVIVVDNDNSPNPEVVMAVEKVKQSLQISYLYEPSVGLSCARNAGWNAAKSDYVVYLDDDAKIRDGYIDILINELYFEPDLVGGPVLPYYVTSKPTWFKDEYAQITNGDQRRFLNQNEFLSGGNFCIRRQLLSKMGGFNPDFGMKGNQIGYGEETLLQVILWELNPNLHVLYNPQLFVVHLVPPRKMKISWKLKSSFEMGRANGGLGLSTEQLRTMRKTALFTLFRLLAVGLIKVLPSTLFRNRTNYPYWQNYAYEIWSKMAAAIGHTIKLLVTK